MAGADPGFSKGGASAPIAPPPLNPPLDGMRDLPLRNVIKVIQNHLADSEWFFDSN